MSLYNKVLTAIHEHAKLVSSTVKSQYEDDYDGYTHSTYEGLACEVVNELYDDGFENPSSKTIRKYVSQMF